MFVILRAAEEASETFAGGKFTGFFAGPQNDKFLGSVNFSHSLLSVWPNCRLAATFETAVAVTR